MPEFVPIRRSYQQESGSDSSSSQSPVPQNRRQVQFVRKAPIYVEKVNVPKPLLRANRSSGSLASQQTSSYALTGQEREAMKMRMSNDKVVSFYKKVLGEIREALSHERQQVKKYL
jgi:hypothetical protein